MINDRLVAFNIIYDVIYNDAFSNIALNKYECNNKKFVTNIVYGVLEKKVFLEAIINELTTTRVKPKIKIILMIGIYQIKFLDSVPDSAACNESVKLCSDIKMDFYSKFVNAVLRNYCRDKELLQNAKNPNIKYSISNDLLSAWYNDYGKENILNMLSCLESKKFTYIVINTLKNNALKIVESYLINNSCEYEIINSNFVKIYGGFELINNDLYKNGYYFIQDYSSYKCSSLINNNPSTVYDMCAAPGGKSFTISINNPHTKVVCFELHNHRIELIKNNATRLGLNNISYKRNDASIYNSELELADYVLCDVPCSGFGTIRHKPEIRYKSPNEFESLPLLQYEILKTSSKYVKEDGYLIYSTCTLLKRENEEVVKKFIDNSDFEIIDMHTNMISIDNGEGFFWAKMKRVINE